MINLSCYLMSVEEELVHRILSVGPGGIKKTDLRREFGDIDTQLDNLMLKGDIFIEKRTNAYFCFHKSHYLQSLLNSDPRFKITYDMIKGLDQSVCSSTRDLVAVVEALAKGVSNLSSVILEAKNGNQSLFSQKLADSADNPFTNLQKEILTVQDFKEHFDVALSSTTSSIGWTELADIRTKICNDCNITPDEFYRLVEDLISADQSKYELSTGGREGIMVRGLLHGFVRCI